MYGRDDEWYSDEGVRPPRKLVRALFVVEDAEPVEGTLLGSDVCVGSSSSSTAGESGSRARWEKARRLHSRSRRVMANELILIVEDNPKNLKLVRDTLQV